MSLSLSFCQCQREFVGQTLTSASQSNKTVIKLIYSQKNALLNNLERHLVSHVSMDSLHCSQKLGFNEPDITFTNDSTAVSKLRRIDINENRRFLTFRTSNLFFLINCFIKLRKEFNFDVLWPSLRFYQFQDYYPDSIGNGAVKSATCRCCFYCELGFRQTRSKLNNCEQFKSRVPFCLSVARRQICSKWLFQRQKMGEDRAKVRF